MLRECIRHEPLAKIVLQSKEFHNFFDYVEMSTFDIASDAFATFKVPKLRVLFPQVIQFVRGKFDRCVRIILEKSKSKVLGFKDTRQSP